MYSSKCLVLVAALVAVTFARSTPSNSINAIGGSEVETPRAEDATSYMGDFRFLYKIYQECSATDLTSCLKLKLITAMDRAARSLSTVSLLDGVSFVKENSAVATETSPKSEADIESHLPRALTERNDALNNMLFEKIGNFFETHTLQVKLPTAADLQRSFNGEERGKKKKMGGLLLIPLILGGTLVPLALGALALLAGKALIVSKLALVLAGIIGLKKLLGGGGGGHESGHEVVVSGGHSSGGGGGGGGWGRSYLKEEAAQNLAYSAYAPKATTS